MVCSKLSWVFLTLHKPIITWNSFRVIDLRCSLKKELLELNLPANTNDLQFTSVHTGCNSTSLSILGALLVLSLLSFQLATQHVFVKSN